MLRYAKGRAPPALTAWQATPNADWNSLSKEEKEEVRRALRRDQGDLCAYCQRRIPAKDEPMKVEHYQPQSTGEATLRWTNLLGVCLGGEGEREDQQHCDTARRDAGLFLHPLEGHGPSPREHLRYTAEGDVRPHNAGHVSVKRDIGILNMDAFKLRRARRVVYERLQQSLEKAGWSAKALRDEHRACDIQPGVAALPQCEVVRYHVCRWAKKHAVPL